MFKIIQKTVSNYEEWWKHVYWMRLSSRERSDYYYWHSYNAWLKLNFFFILYKDTTGTNFRCWQLPKLWDKQGYSIWHERQSLNEYLIAWYFIFSFYLYRVVCKHHLSIIILSYLQNYVITIGYLATAYVLYLICFKEWWS